MSSAWSLTRGLSSQDVYRRLLREDENRMEGGSETPPYLTQSSSSQIKVRAEQATAHDPGDRSLPPTAYSLQLLSFLQQLDQEGLGEPAFRWEKLGEFSSCETVLLDVE